MGPPPLASVFQSPQAMNDALAPEVMQPNPGPQELGSPDRAWDPLLSQGLFQSPQAMNGALAPEVMLDDHLDSSDTDPIPESVPFRPVFASANVNSLRSKFEEIEVLIGRYGFPVFGIQETKLCSTSSAEISIPGYKFFRHDRSKTHQKPSGGGVGLYVHVSLRPRQPKFHSAPDCELVLVEVFQKAGGGRRRPKQRPMRLRFSRRFRMFFQR